MSHKLIKKDSYWIRLLYLRMPKMVICFRPLDEKIMTHVGEPIAMMVDTAYTSYNSQLSPC